MTTQSAPSASARDASISKQSAVRRPNPLLAVTRWELDRALTNRATWIIAALLFVLCLLLLEYSDLRQMFAVSATIAPSGAPVQRVVQGALTRNTFWGLAVLLPITLLEFGLFLPFVTTDGVSLDLRRRTHELIMTTALPSWAYVWGRYVAVTIIALGLAMEYLLALLIVDVGLHLTQADVYPAIDLPGTVAIWVVLVLPATLLLGSLSFALGVVLPRQSNVIKAGVVFVWFLFGTVLPAFFYDQVRYAPTFLQGQQPSWWTAYETWEPTGIAAGQLFLHQFVQRLYAIVSDPTLSGQAVQSQTHTLESQAPDLSSYIGPHLIWVVVSLAAVIGASLAFRRFRNATH
jgi:hypothetical protein